MTIRPRELGILAGMWWLPAAGILCIAGAIWLHLSERGTDSHFVLALLTLGGTMAGRAERSYYRAKHRRQRMTEEHAMRSE
jgi:hypothetical protein